MVSDMREWCNHQKHPKCQQCYDWGIYDVKDLNGQYNQKYCSCSYGKSLEMESRESYSKKDDNCTLCKRPNWDEIWMGLSIEISKRSTCSNPNRNVGCVIVDSNNERVLALGYNGVASGEDHICEFNCNSSDIYRCKCIHSEQNALIKLNTFDPCSKTMYITLSPCMMCARMIINARINVVKYLSEYSDTNPINFLKNMGVVVEKFNFWNNI